MSYPFNETAELFGAPPEHDMQVRLLGEQIIAAATAFNRAEALRDCLQIVQNIQGDAYSEMLPLAFDASAAGFNFEWLKAFFHASARCGETRAYSSVVASLLAYEAGLQHKPGDA